MSKKFDFSGVHLSFLEKLPPAALFYFFRVYSLISLAVCPSGYLRASYHVYKIGCLLVRGIPLPVAQLCVIVIENIYLLGGGAI